MQIQKVIEQFGYSPQEAKVYMASLRLGESTISRIAKTAHIPRSTAQTCVDRLKNDGLMHFYVRKRYKYWTAENPRYLLTKLQRQEAQVKEVIPRLDALRKNSGPIGVQTKVRVLKGTEEVELLFSEMLSKQFPISAVLPHKTFLDVYSGKQTWKEFEKNRIAKSLPMKVLIDEAPDSKQFFRYKDKTLTQVKTISRAQKIDTAFFIYGTSVALIMHDGVTATCVIMKDGDISNTAAMFFEKIWQGHDSPGISFDTAAIVSEKVFFSVTENLPYALLVTDANAQIVYVNKSWEKLFQYRCDQVMGENPRFLSSSKTPQKVYQRLWQNLKDGELFETNLVIDKKKDGSTFDMHTFVFPITVESAVYYVQILEDITHKKNQDKIQENIIQKFSDVYADTCSLADTCKQIVGPETAHLKKEIDAVIKKLEDLESISQKK